MSETDDRATMTAPTPEQMRVLADEHEEAAKVWGLRGFHNHTAATLRAAADQLEAAKSDAKQAGQRITDLLAYSVKLQDQLEAVRRYVTDGDVEDDNGQHVVYTYGLAPLLGITSDTAPQEDEDPDDEEFCARCYAGVDSGEHHEKCMVTGFAEDSESASPENRDE